LHIYRENINIQIANFISLQKLIMKKFWLLALSLILVAWTLAGCGSDKQQPDSETSNNTWDFIIEDITHQKDAVVEYNDQLVDLASNCIIAEDNVWNVFDDENAPVEDIENAIKETIATCTTAGEEISKLWDWEWDSSLKDWVLDIISKDIAYYSKLPEILPYIDKQDLSAEENEKYEWIHAELDALDSDLAQANENLIAIQEQFAKDHGYELLDEEIAE